MPPFPRLAGLGRQQYKGKHFHDDEHDPKIRLSEKGNRRRTISLNHLAAEAIREYIEQAYLKDGPLFRAHLNPRSTKLGR